MTLAQLFDGGELQAADKLFTEWVWFSDGEFDDTDIDPEKITVSTIDDPLSPGLRFDLSGGGMRPVSDLGDDIYLDFGYTVEVLDPTMRINSMQTDLTNWSVQGLGAIDILSFALDASFDDLGLTTVFVDVFDEGNGPEFDRQLSDTAPLPQKSLMFVDNLIDLFGDDGTATLFGFDQTFMQTEATVPEPATMLLLGAGLAFLFLRHRRELSPARARSGR